MLPTSKMKKLFQKCETKMTDARRRYIKVVIRDGLTEPQTIYYPCDDEPVDTGPKYVKIVIDDGSPNPEKICYRTKKTARMGKVMDYYSEKEGVHVSTLRFLYDGQRIMKDDTPEKLEMEDETRIEVYQEKIGG